MHTLTRFVTTLTLSTAAAACGGEDGDETQEPPVEEYACLHVAEGDVVDVALDRDGARTVTVGRSPYRVNLYPEEAGFLHFSTAGAADLVLVADFAGAMSAVWNGDEREEIGPGAPNEHCEEDLPEVIELQVPGGDHWLEVGPVNQANVWMMLAER